MGCVARKELAPRGKIKLAHEDVGYSTCINERTLSLNGANAEYRRQQPTGRRKAEVKVLFSASGAN